MSLNRMILCSKLKNGLCKIFIKLQVVTKCNVTKSRLHCTIVDPNSYEKRVRKSKFTANLTIHLVDMILTGNLRRPRFMFSRGVERCVIVQDYK